MRAYTSYTSLHQFFIENKNGKIKKKKNRVSIFSQGSYWWNRCKKKTSVKTKFTLIKINIKI